MCTGPRRHLEVDQVEDDAEAHVDGVETALMRRFGQRVLWLGISKKRLEVRAITQTPAVFYDHHEATHGTNCATAPLDCLPELVANLHQQQPKPVTTSPITSISPITIIGGVLNELCVSCPEQQRPQRLML